MRELRDQVICGDCVEVLRKAAEPFADLVFADPPFNIGYKYDKYYDEKASDKYLAWTREWIACPRLPRVLLHRHHHEYVANPADPDDELVCETGSSGITPSANRPRTSSPARTRISSTS
jgi:hypothetical protein